MKWENHKIVTISIVYLFTSNVISALIAGFGALFPDLIEGSAINSRSKHRTVSHWFPLYAIPLVLVIFSFSGEPYLLSVSEVVNNLEDFLAQEKSYYIVKVFSLWFLVGCLFHIFEDSLTGRIPLKSPFRKVLLFRKRLFHTGSFKEYLFSFLIFGVAFLKFWFLMR